MTGSLTLADLEGSLALLDVRCTAVIAGVVSGSHGSSPSMGRMRVCRTCGIGSVRPARVTTVPSMSGVTCTFRSLRVGPRRRASLDYASRGGRSRTQPAAQQTSLYLGHYRPIISASCCCLGAGAGTTDAVFVLTDVRDTCVQSALSYGTSQDCTARHHSPSSDGLCGIREHS